MLNKNVFFTNHAKIRAMQRLNINAQYDSFLFEIKLKEIFNKARPLYLTDDGKIEYEGSYQGKKVVFICSKNYNKIVVNTVLIK